VVLLKIKINQIPKTMQKIRNKSSLKPIEWDRKFNYFEKPVKVAIFNLA